MGQLPDAPTDLMSQANRIAKPRGAQMTTTETFQLSLAAAEAYESMFVPALFAEWAPLVADGAGLAPGQSVLDVACGTGVVAKEAASRVGASGRVVAVDVNEAMLTVARRLSVDVDWRTADACRLPFPDASFDAVVCQAALMFFPNPAAAVREMARVVNDGGTVAVQVWGSLDSQPAYGRFVEVAARHVGPAAADLLGSYWVMGDLDRLQALFVEAGLTVTATKTHVGTARFGSLQELVRIEVESTPLIERITDDVYSAILADACDALARFETPEGKAEVPIVGHVLTGRRWLRSPTSSFSRGGG
jgi:SAM-dependent methyltransferase